jgi:hypothetical protein
MTKLFEWMNNLTYFQGIMILFSVAFVMLIIPYAKTIYNVIILLIKAEKPEILSFDYRIAPDHLFSKTDKNELYLLARDQGFIVNGSAIILTWSVKAAYRVDLLPYGKNLTGNSATVTVKNNNRVFTLEIYTLARGKLRKTIEIPENLIVDINNLKFSRANEYVHRKPPQLKIKRLSAQKPQIWHFEFQVFKTLKEKIAAFSGKRYQYKNKNGAITENQALDTKITNYKILKSYDFNLNKYNDTYQKSREETKKQFNYK